jgi:hypothetical protein
VAIGLNSGDISKVVADQSKEITALRSQISETNSILATLVPGFKEAAGIKGPNLPVNKLQTEVKTTHETHTGIVKADGSDIVYFEITQDQLKAMFAMAEKIFTENGGDFNSHPFWKKIKSDPGFKEATMQQVAEKFRSALHTHKEINNQFLSGK